MIKIHPVFFFILFFLKIFTPFSNRADLRCLSVWCHTDEGRSHNSLIDTSVLAQTTLVSTQTRPEWAVINCFTAGADVDKNDS